MSTVEKVDDGTYNVPFGAVWNWLLHNWGGATMATVITKGTPGVAGNDPNIVVFYATFQAHDPVNLNDPIAVSGFNYLVAQGYITQQQVPTAANCP